jgi:hypothetical protein
MKSTAPCLFGAPGEMDSDRPKAIFTPCGAPAASRTLTRFFELRTAWFVANDLFLFKLIKNKPLHLPAIP